VPAFKSAIVHDQIPNCLTAVLSAFANSRLAFSSVDLLSITAQTVVLKQLERRLCFKASEEAFTRKQF
jgi:hypothetical protein